MRKQNYPPAGKRRGRVCVEHKVPVPRSSLSPHWDFCYGDLLCFCPTCWSIWSVCVYVEGGGGVGAEGRIKE